MYDNIFSLCKKVLFNVGRMNSWDFGFGLGEFIK